MILEDAVKIVHDMSEQLARLVELEGDLAMVSEGTSQHASIQESVDKTKTQISDLVAEFENYGLEKIKDHLAE